MVRLALTRSRTCWSPRNAASPVSSSAATASSRAAHSATTTPSGVSVDPRGVRAISATPARDSAERTRADTACWVMPSCREAAFRLPVRATASSISRAFRSGTRSLSGTTQL